MGVIKSQSIKNSIAIYAGHSLGMFNKMVLFPIAFLNNETSWGLLTLLIATGTILSSIASLGYSKAIQRFLPIRMGNRKELLVYSFRHAGFGLVILTLFGFLFHNLDLGEIPGNLTQIRDNFPLLLFFFFGYWMYEMASGIFNASYQSFIPMIFNNVIVRIGVLIFLLLAIFYNLSISDLMLGIGASYLISFLILFIWSLRSLTTREMAFPISGSYNQREIRSYATFMLIAVLISQLNVQLDIFILSGVSFLGSLAYLDLAKNLSSFVEMPTRALSAATVSHISRLMEQDNLEEVRSIFHRGAFVQMALGMILIAGIGVNLKWLVSFLPTSNYSIVVPVFYILSIAKFIDLATGLNWMIISNSKYYWVNLRISIFSIAATGVVQYFLARKFGIVGVAWGVAFGMLLINGLRTTFLYYKFKIKPFNTNHAKLIPLAVALLGAFILPLPGEIKIVMANVIVCSSALIFYWKNRQLI